jgi:hypothetical protein
MLQQQPSRRSHSPKYVIDRLSLALCLTCQHPSVFLAKRASCLVAASLAHQRIICGDAAGYSRRACRNSCSGSISCVTSTPLFPVHMINQKKQKMRYINPAPACTLRGKQLCCTCRKCLDRMKFGGCFCFCLRLKREHERQMQKQIVPSSLNFDEGWGLQRGIVCCKMPQIPG